MTKEEKKPHEIPEGTYGIIIFVGFYFKILSIKDVGEGYYEPIKSIIYEYNGSILRTPSEAEVILAFFRLDFVLFLFKGG